MENVQRVVVAAILINHGRALILKRSPDEDVYPNMWELPSGKVSFGEDPNSAVIREFLEETCLAVEVVRPFLVTHYTIEKPNVKRHTIQIFFLVKLMSDSPVKLSPNHVDFAWITSDQLGSYEIFDDVAESVRMAFKSL